MRMFIVIFRAPPIRTRFRYALTRLGEPAKFSTPINVTIGQMADVFFSYQRDQECAAIYKTAE